jgi:putative pyruvate formate lyase activating enzyme
VGWRPSYLDLAPAELHARAAEAYDLLGPRCVVCPRGCKVDRREDVKGLCAIGRDAVVASYFPHFGEEDCLRGSRGSGTIFFSGCNLRCVFCLPPGSLIATETGPRAIDKIFAGAVDELAVADGHARRALDVRVRTVTGELAPASKAFRHPYRGELVRLKPLNGPEIRLTPNHRVFAARRTAPHELIEVPAGELTRDHLLVEPKPIALERRAQLELVAVSSGGAMTREAISPTSSQRGWAQVLVPLDGVEREPYDGPVYNLEVDHPTHSYLAPAVAVANCQNHDISWEVRGERVGPARLGGMMLELQAIGCHNINWVTPEHVVPQILEALPHAIAGGLTLPIVYNTSSYDSPDSLRLMEGIVDVYMPDFKVWTRERARRYLKRPDYADVARETVREMHRQVGDLVVDENGMARRGVILRHLIMPGQLDETEAILRFVADELGQGCYVNLMAQYYVSGKVGQDGQYEEIARGIRRAEYKQALAVATDLGLRLDPRSRADGLALAAAG